LLVAGLGLVIGALIASALPKSEIEENLAGDASSAMKRKAREAAAAGFDAAKGATGEILANVAQQAAAEGLTPDGLARGAQDVGQRVQRVAERAVTTAFDPDHHSDDTAGGRQHG
jgi:anti-sigma factor RsiW